MTDRTVFAVAVAVGCLLARSPARAEDDGALAEKGRAHNGFGERPRRGVEPVGVFENEEHRLTSGGAPK